MSGSHASDEGISPKTSDVVNTRLSVDTGASERPGDQTFHTEEWVRVSDFDVGTPTSTTAKSDYDAAAEDSYGDVRAQDKLVDWETVSRDNAGNSSSAEDIGDAENVVVEYSSGFGQDHGQKLSLVDKVLSDSSDKEDDAKSVSSRSDGGKSSHSSSSSSSRSSRSTVHSSAAFAKKSDDEERSSSIVVVPSHGDESQESSYAEVASVEARDDDYHGIGANLSSPETKGVEHQASSAIEPVSSDEQEEENYESYAGVEDQAISTIEPVSSEEEEEEKYRLFTDVSNLKDLLEHEESSGDPITLPSGYDSFSSFLSSRMNESADVESEAQDSSEVPDAKIETPGVLEEKHQTGGKLEMEEHQVPEAKEVGPEMSEVKESEQQVVEAVTPEPQASSLSEIHASDQNLQEGGNTVEEFAESIEPTTPEKASEKSSSENPYAFVRSISDEEVFEGEYSSPSEKKQAAPSEMSPEAQDVDENIAKEVQDAPFSSGIPEPDHHELNQLLEIAHSKEIANLGKQEEKLLAKEEHDLGKGIVEPQPLVEVLSAIDDPKPLEGGELKDLQPVEAEEAPLLKDSPTPAVSGFQIEAELKEKAPELCHKESEHELHEENNVGFGDEHQSAETLVADDTSSADLSSQMEEPLAGKERQILEIKSEGDSSSSVDHLPSLQLKELPTKNDDVTLVPLSSIPDSEIPKSTAEFTKDVGVTSLAGDVDRSREISRSSEKSEQVAIVPHRKVEVSFVGLFDVKSMFLPCISC